MRETSPILIGEVTVDFTMPTRMTDAKVRLGGVVHAARGLWATGRDYSVGAFCPSYLVEQTRNYLTQHGCREFVLLGEVTGAPNVIAIADAKEVGHQGYEDILRDERRVIPSYDRVDLSRFDPVVIFPGRYDLREVVDRLKPKARVTIDAAYDVDRADVLRSLKGRIDSLVISTSSILFSTLATGDVAPLLDVYVASRGVLSTSRVRVGLPLALSTMTDSLKVAVTKTLSPAFTKLFCIPGALVIATLLTVGASVSIA